MNGGEIYRTFTWVQTGKFLPWHVVLMQLILSMRASGVPVLKTTGTEWSITDVEKGVRTVNSIISASKLPAKYPRRFNCSHAHLLQAIPIHRVINNLHLFPRATNNLFITELRHLDGIEKYISLDSCGAANINEYQSF